MDSMQMSTASERLLVEQALVPHLACAAASRGDMATFTQL